MILLYADTTPGLLHLRHCPSMYICTSALPFQRANLCVCSFPLAEVMSSLQLELGELFIQPGSLPCPTIPPSRTSATGQSELTSSACILPGLIPFRQAQKNTSRCLIDRDLALDWGRLMTGPFWHIYRHHRPPVPLTGYMMALIDTHNTY